jgi:hypothetical protein
VGIPDWQMLQFGGVKGTRFGASPHRSRPQTSQTAAKSAKEYQDACLTPCSSADSKLGTHDVQENRRKRRQPHHAISSATPTAVERLCHEAAFAVQTSPSSQERLPPASLLEEEAAQTEKTWSSKLPAPVSHFMPLFHHRDDSAKCRKRIRILRHWLKSGAGC